MPINWQVNKSTAGGLAGEVATLIKRFLLTLSGLTMTSLGEMLW